MYRNIKYFKTSNTSPDSVVPLQSSGQFHRLLTVQPSNIRDECLLIPHQEAKVGSGILSK